MINYDLLAQSIKFYENQGFTRIDAPWWVSKEVLDITKPEGVDRSYYIPLNEKSLVASAEQSFIYLMIKGLLPKNRYQSITPCYRYEPFDVLHKKYFMKNELFIPYSSSEEDLSQMIGIAEKWFSQFLDNVSILETNEPNSVKSFDLMSKGVELGSYGIRDTQGLKWIYGTACAEPRLSHLIESS